MELNEGAEYHGEIGVRHNFFLKIYIFLLMLKVTNICCVARSTEISACFSGTSTPAAMIEQLR